MSEVGTQHSRKILWIVCIPLPGHMFPLLKIGRRIAQENGWTVKFASAERARKYLGPFISESLEFISLGMIEETPSWSVIEEEVSSLEKGKDFTQTSITIWRWMIEMWKPMYEGLVKETRNPFFQTPTAVLADFMTYAGADFASELGVRLIVNNADILSMVGPHHLPIYDAVPGVLSQKSIKDLSWIDCNILCPIVRFIFPIVLKFSLEKQFNRRRKEVGLRPIKLVEFLPKETLILVNSAFGLEYPRPLPPLVHMTGPIIDETVEFELSDELRKFMDDSNGIVFVNMGTLAECSKSIETSMIRAFGKFERKLSFLWKFKGNSIPKNIPPNVLITHWVDSQLKVLKHPKVVLFISHCGINSAQEALYCQVPILCIPMFGDQLDMAFRVFDAGAGLVLKKELVTESTLRKCIQELGHPRFKKNAIRLKAVLEQPGGVSKASKLILEYSSLSDSYMKTLVLPNSPRIPWNLMLVLLLALTLPILVPLSLT